jgi:hypothetical protein
MFDAKTSEKLGFYVYALRNPITSKVFYIGKGTGNRVFSHIQEILDGNNNLDQSLKRSEIGSIISSGRKIEHFIVRHGLSEKEAFLLESSLIDFSKFFLDNLTNAVNGHHSHYYGIKSTDELIRQYNAPPLTEISHPVVIININKRYQDTRSNSTSVYEATKQAWVISQKSREKVKFALAEFQGIIIGVFEILEWYPVLTSNNANNNRWGFNGKEADELMKSYYLNKSISALKKRGAANPIRFTL